MNKILNKINKFSLSFLTLVFLFVFTTQQAKADCIIDGVQFDIGGRPGSGVTAIDHGNPITNAEFAGWDTTGDDVTTCDVSHLTSLLKAFRNLSDFNQDIGTWDVSNVNNFRLMFEGVTNFNQDIGGWDMSSATNISAMFDDNDAFNQNIGSWDVSNVSNFGNMFSTIFRFF